MRPVLPGCYLLLLFFISTALLEAAETLRPSLPNETKSSPVVIVHDAAAVDVFRARTRVVKSMVDSGITNLTLTANVRDAWRTMVSSNDVVGLKVFSTPGPNSGTRPAVVAAVVEGLITSGIPPKNIVIWDRQLGDLRLAGFDDIAARYGVRLAGSVQSGYDSNAFYDTALLGSPVWGDLEFGKAGAGIGRRSYVTKLLTHDITKIINITPMLNHPGASVAGNLYSLALGSVDNVGRFEAEPERLAAAVPEIYAMTNLSDHVALNITDALICQYEGGEKGLLHYSAALGEIRISRDPLALDSLSIAELEKLRKATEAPKVKINTDLYKNAALLELGIEDVKKIPVRRIELEPSLLRR